MAKWFVAWLVVMAFVALVGLTGILSAHAFMAAEVNFGMLSLDQDWEFIALSYGIPFILLSIGLAGIFHGMCLIKKMHWANKQGPTPINRS